MNLIEREPTVAAPCHLVPSGEKAAHALTDVVIDTAERCHRRSEIEVARPAPECPVQIVAHLGPGIGVARHQQLAHFCLRGARTHVLALTQMEMPADDATWQRHRSAARMATLALRHCPPDLCQSPPPIVRNCAPFSIFSG